MPENPQQFTHGDYTIGWICALPETELVAAAAMLDEEHPVLPAADLWDTNSYILGRIGEHNVVIACLPAETTGKVSAATVAKDMLRSFPAVRFGLMVGIGGGAPYYGAQRDNDAKYSGDEEEDSEVNLEEIRDIRLGDVIISLHSKSTEAVVQYDFGKSLQEKQFVQTGGKLNKPPAVVLSAVAILQQQHKRKGNKVSELLMEAERNNPGMSESFRYPGSVKDRLFKSEIVHKEDRKSCKACCGPNNINLVRRPDRHTSAPRIHYGTIGSADQVMKDAVLRDQWAQKEKIICFEMEAAEQLRDEVLSWLSPLDYNAKQNDTFTRHTPGTGTWLLNTSSFTTWIETPRQTLYCPGIPGAGKTVLASVVIEHLRQMLHDKNAATAFIFCAYNEHWKTEDLIACLLKQLTCQMPSLPDEVKKLYELYRVQKTTPRKYYLIQTLVSISSSFPRVFVVVDAIDECPDDSRADFIDAIMKIKPWANILVTSRPIASIERLLHWDLREPIRAIDEDITTYIEAEISNQIFTLSSDLSRKPELCSRIVTQIVASAEGMFLHAQFHVKYLAPKHNIRDLREALENLPKTSGKIYEKAMERVQSQEKDTTALAMKTLLCVVGAARPLHIREIQHALAVRETDQNINDEALTAPNYLLSICAGLLTVDEESNIIRLVHYTAQEYFKENEYKYFSNAQAEIASICLRYLSLEVFSQGYCPTDEQYETRAKTHVLLEYATKNLGKHISGEIEDKVIQSAVKLFSNKSKVSSATQAAFIQTQQYGRNSQVFPRDFYGIHYASYLGWADVINQLLVSYEKEVDLQDSYSRTPLSWAAENGHKAVVKLLLDTGRQGGCVFKRYNSPDTSIMGCKE
ncbi:uncharacterized protein BDV17DRAFT_290253 [Aspergillus undulatus]|uniref:uncharacterized protein n=1 Tax=Aspergillus undulatus TaxID=1810928 RepID=UPI003CCDA6A5